MEHLIFPLFFRRFAQEQAASKFPCFFQKTFQILLDFSAQIL